MLKRCLLAFKLFIFAFYVKCVVYVSSSEEEFVQFTLTFANERGRRTSQTFLTYGNPFAQNNISKEKVESLVLHPNSDGLIEGVSVDGKYVNFVFDVTSSLELMSYEFPTSNGTKWIMNSDNFTNISLSNFDDDTSLLSLSLELDWNLTTAHNTTTESVNITLMSSVNTMYMQIGDNTVLNISHQYNVSSGLMVQWGGIYVVIVNQKTGHVMYNCSFNTQQPLSENELTTLLQALRPGRKIVIMTTLNECSTNLGNSLRLLFRSLGSIQIPFLKKFDAWCWVWIVGGKSVGESMVIQNKELQNKKVFLEVNLKFHTSHNESACWIKKTDTLWQKRGIFCSKFEGYGKYCNCTDPYVAPPFLPLKTFRENIAVVILSGSRTKYLFRLVQQLLEQPGINRTSILISIDGIDEEMIRLVETFGLNYVVFQPSGALQRRISRHLRFALFNSLRQYPNLDKFIILEDDLTISPDFYSFMQQTSVLLDNDTSVYAVSAYSHLAFDHTARDIHKLYRAHTMPSYGWMVKRNFLEFVLPMWPPVEVVADWDYWILSNVIRKDREVVFPEIPRVCHSSARGLHSSGFFSMKYFSNKPSSTKSDSTVNIFEASIEEYEKRILKLLKIAKVLPISDPPEESFPTKALNIWDVDKRGDHHGMWILPFYNTTLLIVGVPYSKYTKYVYKMGEFVFEPTEEMRRKADKKRTLYVSSEVIRQDTDFLYLLGLQKLPSYML